MPVELCYLDVVKHVYRMSEDFHAVAYVEGFSGFCRIWATLSQEEVC